MVHEGVRDDYLEFTPREQIQPFPERDYAIDDYLDRGIYEIGEHHMRIRDVVWGQEYIGDKPYDQLLVDLAKTPLFQRLLSVEQLTLNGTYATMPNSMYFSRAAYLKWNVCNHA